VDRVVAAQVVAARDAAAQLGAEAARLRASFPERAREAYAITLTAYEEGAATLLQVLDASRALGDARLLYFRAVFARHLSMLELAVAAGAEPTAAGAALAPSRSGPAGDPAQPQGWE
jgi:outer membrane protein TolC